MKYAVVVFVFVCLLLANGAALAEECKRARTVSEATVMAKICGGKINASQFESKDQALVYVNLGYAFSLLYRYHEAYDAFEKAAALDGSYDELFKERGDILQGQIKLIELVNESTHHLEVDPDNIEAYLQRAQAYLKLKRPKDALPDLDKIVELRPKDGRAKLQRGLAWQESGNFDKALVNINQAIKEDPSYLEAYLQRGNLWQKKGEPAKAVSEYSAIIRRNPSYIPAYQQRGSVFQALGRFMEAIADYNQILMLDPDSETIESSVRLKRGFCWQALGQYTKAYKDYKEAGPFHHPKAAARLLFLMDALNARIKALLRSAQGEADFDSNSKGFWQLKPSTGWPVIVQQKLIKNVIVRRTARGFQVRALPEPKMTVWRQTAQGLEAAKTRSLVLFVFKSKAHANEMAGLLNLFRTFEFGLTL